MRRFLGNSIGLKAIVVVSTLLLAGLLGKTALGTPTPAPSPVPQDHAGIPVKSPACSGEYESLFVFGEHFN